MAHTFAKIKGGHAVVSIATYQPTLLRIRGICDRGVAIVNAHYRTSCIHTGATAVGHVVHEHMVQLIAVEVVATGVEADHAVCVIVVCVRVVA